MSYLVHDIQRNAIRADITHAMLLEWKSQDVLYHLQNIARVVGLEACLGRCASGGGCIERHIHP